MPGRRKAIYIVATTVVLGSVLAAVLVWAVKRYNLARPIILRGAVIKQDDDPMKESPITDVAITDLDGQALEPSKSTFTGFFSIRLRHRVGPERPVTLEFRHPDYKPLVITEPVSDKLLVVQLAPIHPEVQRVAATDRPMITITNVRIRYTTEAATQDNIGTGVKMFEVQNTGNVACNNTVPCSPDRRWKASTASASLDAGEGNVFRNARVSCIAGPCPFTRIDNDGFSQGGRVIKVTVRDWSDTATFLMQAEVFRPQIADMVRMTYPIILGTSLNFTLPPTANGPSLEAELNGENIVFPLGPEAILSWADCKVSVAKTLARFYRCELNAGYRFR
jgi:hypothetical protein